MNLTELDYGELLDAIRKDLQPDASTFLLHSTVIADNLAAMPHGRLTRVANQAIPDITVTPIVWDAAVLPATYGNGGMIASTAGLKVPRDGLYLVTVAIGWDIASAVGRRLGIFTGVPIGIADDVPGATASIATDSVSTVQRVAAGTVIGLSVFQNSGAPLNVLGNATFQNEFTATFLSN